MNYRKNNFPELVPAASRARRSEPANKRKHLRLLRRIIQRWQRHCTILVRQFAWLILGGFGTRDLQASAGDRTADPQKRLASWRRLANSGTTIEAHIEADADHRLGRNFRSTAREQILGGT